MNSNTVKSIQDIMRKDAGTYGDAQRIEQLAWLFFLKILDDADAEQELMEENYQSAVPKGYRWRDWAADEEGITGDGLLDFINNELIPGLRNLTILGPRTQVIKTTFDDANNYMKNGTLLRQVVNKVNEVDFNSGKDRHLFGDVYEKILQDLQSAGNAGEFYTPRAVTDFMVQMVNPRLGETVFDPACGTGGFLTGVIEHIRSNDVKTPADREVLQKSISGVEKKHLPHILCVTNMMLHGIEVPNRIRHDNTLSRPLRDYGPKDRVDVIVTNPPFGGMEEDGIELNFPKQFRTRETADLFLVLIMNLLKPGGRAAVVLPDGFLFGEGIKTRIKEKLLTDCNLHTIVRLPNGVFNPYTGIKTNLLFFEKGEPTKDIWFFEHPYPEGYKNYSRTRPLTLKEFDREKDWWEKREETEYAWKLTAKEVTERNYNLDCKNPHIEHVEELDPEELMAEYQKTVAELRKAQDALKKELMEALADR